MTAIFVTHDQTEAFSMADKIGVLDRGRLSQFDTPEQLYRYPVNSTVARFLGFSNLVKGQFDRANSRFQCALGSFLVAKSKAACAELAGSGDAILLIRPEGAKVAKTDDAAKDIKNLLRGRVTSRSYLGSSYKLSLQAGNINLTFELALDPPPPCAGEEITLLISESALVLV